MAFGKHGLWQTSKSYGGPPQLHSPKQNNKFKKQTNSTRNKPIKPYKYLKLFQQFKFTAFCVHLADPEHIFLNSIWMPTQNNAWGYIT